MRGGKAAVSFQLSAFSTLSGWNFGLLRYTVRDVRRVVAILLLATASAVVALAQGNASCKRAEFTAHLQANKSFSKSLNSGLQLGFTAVRNLGWVVSVSPVGGEDQDWTSPVNLPLLTGERQYLATGYGNTVKQRLAYAHYIRFVLTETDYVRYSKMADDALYSKDPAAAGEYIPKMPQIPAGLLTITPLDFITSQDGQTVEKARLKITVTVPADFSTTSSLSWEATARPKPED